MNPTAHARPAVTLAATLLVFLPTLLASLPVVQASTPAPTSVAAATGPGPGVLTLTWSPPNGGGSIVGYRVYRGPSAQSLQTFDVPAATRSYVDRCVGDGQSWSYAVAALDANGEGTRSDVVSATSGIPPNVGDTVAVLGARLPTARMSSSAVWTGSDALIFGGTGVSQILRFDPAQDCVTTMPSSLPSAVGETSAVWEEGNAYVFGGATGQASSSNILRYDPSAGTVTTLPTLLPSPRLGTTAVMADRSYVVGGVESGGDTDEIVDGMTGNVVATLPETRAFSASVWTGEQVFILGGSQDGLEWPEIYVFDPQTGFTDWASAYLAHDGIQGAGVAWDGQYVYLAGGSSYGAGLLDEIQRFDSARANQYEVVPTLDLRLPYPVAFPSSVWDGRHLYLFGGYNHTDDLDTVIRFTPSLSNEHAGPQNLAAVRGPAPGKITLAWQPPADTSGLTGYRIYRGPMTALEIRHADTGTTPSFTDTGLTAGSNWCYKVTALYGSVESRISNEVCAKAPSLPGLPILTQASPGTALGDVRLQWTAPADTGGIPLSGYRVYRDGIAVASPTASPFVDSNVAAWTSHAYAVAAVNDVGEGPKSASLNAYPASTPSMPRNLFVWSPGSGKLQLSWLAPETNGGSAITNYRVYRTDPGGTERWIDEIGPVTSWTDSFVPKGAYAYRVTAVNLWGEGQSPTNLLGNSLVIPSRPDVIGTFGPCAGQVTLQWQVEDNGGTPIIDFKIYRSLIAGTVGTLITTLPGTNSMYTDSPGASNINYYYFVESRNAKGPSISYEEPVFVPPGGCVPGAPTPVPNPIPPGVVETWCGTTDVADLDDDKIPDCMDDDDDWDHLADSLEEMLGLDPRSAHSDRNRKVEGDIGDGIPDTKDILPLQLGNLGIGLEVIEVCVNQDMDTGLIAEPYRPADPYVDSGRAIPPAIRINSVDPPESLKLDFPKLRYGDHYHNYKPCNVDIANNPPSKIRNVRNLPSEFVNWDFKIPGDFANVAIPLIRIDLPLADHDTFDCNGPELGTHHVCGENIAGNDNIGVPNVDNFWSLMNLEFPGDASVAVGTLNTGSLEGVPFTIKLADPDVGVKFRARINAGGCDMVNALLGQALSLPKQGSNNEVKFADDFRGVESQGSVGDVCGRV